MKTANPSGTSRGSWSAWLRPLPCPSISGMIPKARNTTTPTSMCIRAIWRHGDFIEINERGGVVIYGRSDATLNPGGVRIGTAEIYRQVETIDGIDDSLVVGQDWKGDVRVILFVKLDGGSGTDRGAQEQDQHDPPDECLASPCAGQDHRRAGYSLHAEHEEGRAVGEEGHRGQGRVEQGCPEESGVSRFLCGVSKNSKKIDGFVKSPSAALRFIFRHCGVLLCTPHSSRFARLASGAFYCAVQFDDFLRSHQD